MRKEFAFPSYRDDAERAVTDSYILARVFESAFALSAGGMALVGLDGRWLHVNRAMCDMLGYTEQELRALTVQQVTHPRDMDRDLAYISALLVGNVPSYQVEKRYFHKNGSPISVQLHVALARRDDGRPDFFIAQVSNIAARKQNESELDIFFGLTSDLLSVFHTDGYLESVNPAWTRVLGWTAEELTERPLIEFVHPDDREVTMIEMELASRGMHSPMFVNRYRHRNGDYRWLEWINSALRGNRVYCVARDVTAQRNG
jgi:PAS domain S-box-containing protein